MADITQTIEPHEYPDDSGEIVIEKDTEPGRGGERII